jgi:hypothetical protein
MEHIFAGFVRPPKGSIVIDPYASASDALTWVGPGYIQLAYDANPKNPGVFRRDCLQDPPKFSGGYLITVPPHRKKSDSAATPEQLQLMERYGHDDLYKCFMRTVLKALPLGGIIVLPLSFLTSSRESDRKRRNDFFLLNRPSRINIFEYPILDKEGYTIAIQFTNRTQLSDYSRIEDDWPLYFYASPLAKAEERVLTIRNRQYMYLPGFEPFENDYVARPEKAIAVRYRSDDKPILPAETYLSLSLQSQDVPTRRAGLYFEPDSRQFIIRGIMSKSAQQRLARDYRELIEAWRLRTNSLFMSFATDGTLNRRISSVMTVEAIQRIIWSYVTKPKSKALS